MEGNKLEISGRVAADPPPASYKQLPDGDADGKFHNVVQQIYMY